MPAAIAYGSLVGLSLGLTGSGGSILTIPLLVYGLGMPVPTALAVSLLMVAAIALSGAVRQSFQRNVDWRAAILFSLTGMAVSPLVVWLTRDVPETVRLLSFTGLMFLAAYRMGFSTPPQRAEYTDDKPYPVKIALGGAAAGALAGFFGVGGGFIIVPLLTLLFLMPYHRAVGTSLASIALISLSAVAGAFTTGAAAIDWAVFGWFVAGGFAGMLAGSFFINTIPERSAKMVFAVLTAGLAVYMIIDRLFIYQGGLS